MPKFNKQWIVHPHLPIEELSENLWRAQGTLPKMALRRVMAIARRENGELVIHNAIPLDPASMERIEQWGRPAYLVVPNGYHRLDAFAFKNRYPEIKVLCPRGSRKKVAEVVQVDGCYEDFPADASISFEPLGGVADAEGVMVIRSHDGATLVFNDALFNMPHGKGLMGLFFKHVTASTGGPRVSRLFKLFVVKDRAAFRQSLERLAQTPNLQRIIVSHHRTITANPAEMLLQAARTI